LVARRVQVVKLARNAGAVNEGVDLDPPEPHHPGDPVRRHVAGFVSRYNVFKEELPSDRQSSFAWFLVGLVLSAALLALTTAAET
jgi:hypothetical protein